MKKKSILAASLIAFACACQSKQPMQNNMNDDMKKDEKPADSCNTGGGCCGAQNTQAAPAEPAKAAAPAQQAQATTAVPAVKVEQKAP